MTNRASWIPGTVWDKGHIELNAEDFIVCRDSEDAKIILNNITNEDLLKNTIHAHGTFKHSKGVSIIMHENGNNVLQVDKITYCGKLLITTLDPEHHSVQQTTRDTEEIYKLSKILHENIINWTKHQCLAQSGMRWWLRNIKRRIIGFLHSRLLILSVTIISVLVALYFLIIHKTLFSTIANICSILGIFSLFKKS